MSVQNNRPPLFLEAAGGVVSKIVDNEVKILLIQRKGVWDLPKGKREGNESLPHCAVREVAEETGSGLPMIVRELTETVHEYMEEGREIRKRTVWFSMITTSTLFTPQHEEDIDEIRWVPVDDALEMVGYDNLRKVLLAESRRSKV